MKTELDKKKFFSSMQMLACAYNKRFRIDDEILNVWYKFFNKYRGETVTHVFEIWIESNPNPPTISDLLGYCENYKDWTEDSMIP